MAPSWTNMDRLVPSWSATLPFLGRRCDWRVACVDQPLLERGKRVHATAGVVTVGWRRRRDIESGSAQFLVEDLVDGEPARIVVAHRSERRGELGRRETFRGADEHHAAAGYFEDAVFHGKSTEPDDDGTTRAGGWWNIEAIVTLTYVISGGLPSFQN
jgi:hypothetical protein